MRRYLTIVAILIIIFAVWECLVFYVGVTCFGEGAFRPKLLQLPYGVITVAFIVGAVGLIAHRGWGRSTVMTLSVIWFGSHLCYFIFLALRDAKYLQRILVDFPSPIPGFIAPIIFLGLLMPRKVRNALKDTI